MNSCIGRWIVVAGLVICAGVLGSVLASSGNANRGAAPPTAVCEHCEKGLGSAEAAAVATPSPANRAGVLAAAGDMFGGLLDTSDFPPRWECGKWSRTLGWVHIVSDLMIWGAYMAIPLALLYLVRNRRDVPFAGIFWLFMAFIAACGTGHLVEASIFWWPVYRLDGLVKLFTALVSWATVIALLPVLPRVLALPGLEKMNDELRKEVAERAAAQQQAKARMEELEQTHRIFVGREGRVVELKRKVNELAKQLGQPEPYDLSFAENNPPTLT